jgi:hypothetical protein
LICSIFYKREEKIKKDANSIESLKIDMIYTILFITTTIISNIIIIIIIIIIGVRNIISLFFPIVGVGKWSQDNV